MIHINSYLTFNGNCREAMKFYKDCLGGEVSFLTIEESPMAETIPPHLKKYILHSLLVNENVIIMASDMCSENGLTKGNSVSIFLNCSSEEEIKRLYEKLSAGGRASHALENTFWGALFGDLTDKYGNSWLLNYDGKQKTE
jgi:PhnB protein